MRLRCTATILGLSACLTISACTPNLFNNLTTNKDGNVELLFVNDTNFRAAFSFGSFDSLDREPPGPAVLQQLRLDANTSSDVIAIACNRNTSIGTQKFVSRVLALKLDKSTSNFDPDSFDTTIHFSDAPADSPNAALPVAGAADGIEKMLAVDYGCGDRMVFTFRQDPDANGGFRVDFQLIQN